MPDQRTVFDRIIAGEIPCARVFENEHVFAFLDIKPLAAGHTLVVPKVGAARLAELPPEAAAELGRCLPALVRAILSATGAPACNVLVNDGRQAGQEVPHVHVHLIPRVDEDGLGYRWRAKSVAPAELRTTADRIRAAL